MARVLQEDFFPATDLILRTYAASLYDDIMPSDCKPGLYLGWLNYATLLPLCLSGAIVGLFGTCSISQHPTYRLSFASFMGMNLSALICHCLTPRDSPYKALFVGLDVGFTCCASICLGLAAISRGRKWQRQQELYKLACWACAAALVIAVLGNSWGPGRSIPFLNEVMYMQTTLIAAALLLCKEVLQPGLPADQRAAIIMSAISFYSVPLLVLANPLMCQLSTPEFHWDITHVLFLGCELSYWFLLRYLKLQEKQAAAAAVAPASVSSKEE